MTRIRPISLLIVMILVCAQAGAQTTRRLSGTVITERDEVVTGATVIARYGSGEQRAISDAAGRFSLAVPNVPLTLTVEGKNLQGAQQEVAAGDAAVSVQIKVRYVVPPVHESVVI